MYESEYEHCSVSAEDSFKIQIKDFFEGMIFDSPRDMKFKRDVLNIIYFRMIDLLK